MKITPEARRVHSIWYIRFYHKVVTLTTVFQFPH